MRTRHGRRQRACISVIASAGLTHRLARVYWKSMSTSRLTCRVSSTHKIDVTARVKNSRGEATAGLDGRRSRRRGHGEAGP